jgi:hypothetical protein
MDLLAHQLQTGSDERRPAAEKTRMGCVHCGRCISFPTATREGAPVALPPSRISLEAAPKVRDPILLNFFILIYNFFC